MLQGNDKNASFPEAQASGILFLQTHKTKKFKKKLNQEDVVVQVIDDKLHAFIESLDSHGTKKRLEQIRSHFAIYEWPSSFHFLDEFPRNQNGKIDRKALK